MITAQRQRGRRRAAAVVASLAIAAGLVGGLATAAAADSTAELVGSTDARAQVKGSVDGDSKELSAGLFDVVIDGDVEGTAYCIDIHTGIRAGTTLDEIEWSEANVDNLDKVEAILRWYHPNGDGPSDHQITGTDAQKAAATQAAIWHYTDDFVLDTDGNDDVIVANYDAILAAVEGGLEGFGEPTVTLSITPPASTAGNVGDLVGPYVVNTTASSVTVTPSSGITLHNEDGSPFTGDIVNGTELWLSGPEGDGTITATASADGGTGRVFFKKGSQKLILASTVVTEASAEAGVSFTTTPPPTEPEPTTTTTVPDSTTTVPTTPDTTVDTTAPTTVPVTTDTGGGLPVTGAQSMILVAVAALLLALGAGFGIVSRRKRLESES